MLKKKIVLFDIDGTIVESDVISKALSREFNTIIRQEDVTLYNIHDLAIQLGLITPTEKYDWAAFWENHQDLLFREVALTKGFLEFRHYLRTHQIPYQYITARPVQFKQATYDYFKKHQMKNDFEKIIFGCAPEKKIDYALSLSKPAIIFEDNADTLLRFVNSGLKTVRIKRPHNDEMKVLHCENFYHVGDFTEFLSILQGQHKPSKQVGIS